MVLLTIAAVVVVVVGGLGLAWAATRPSTSKSCTLKAVLDEVGAATPEAARLSWATNPNLDVDIERPDRTSASGAHVTATRMVRAAYGMWPPVACAMLGTDRGDTRWQTSAGVRQWSAAKGPGPAEVNPANVRTVEGWVYDSF